METSDQIKKITKGRVSAIFEGQFFLLLSVRLRLDYETTVFQIKDIHKRISSKDKTLEDYSEELQSLYNYYLIFLKINNV